MLTADELMQEYAMLEQIMTNHSQDEDFVHYCQHMMDKLDEQAERLRWEKEMGKQWTEIII